jgi:uncharacterized lipoprotein
VSLVTAMRRCRATLAGLLIVVALSGCDVLAHETSSSSGGSDLDASSLTCSQLQANGGQLLSTAATELASSVTNGVGSASVASQLQTILIAGCREEKKSFRPGSDALKEYAQENP